MAYGPAVVEGGAKAHYAAVDDGTLAWDQAGSGPPVVLLHAGIADRRMWSEVVAGLRNEFRLVSVDLRGYGESSTPLAPFSHEGDLLRFFDGIGLDSAALVGCSLGGSLALEFALDYPHRVSALALVSSGVRGHECPPGAGRVERHGVGLRRGRAQRRHRLGQRVGNPALG